MPETALIEVPGNLPAIAGLDKKQLKFLREHYDKKLVSDALSGLMSGAKDISVELIKAGAENKIILYIVAIIIVFNLMRLRLLDPVTAAAVNAGLMAMAGWEALTPW